MQALPVSFSRVRRLLRRLLRQLSRTEEKVVRLAPPEGAKDPPHALFSYIIDPFLLRPGQSIPHSHTHFWESRAMAEVLRNLGFQVDVIHWTNRTFLPREPYDVMVDVRLQFDRLASRVGENCLKILHCETSHYRFHNSAQEERLRYLEKRRGIRLPLYKTVEENRAVELADCATILGNSVTESTYAFSGKLLYRIPISQPFLYDFPHNKDFRQVRHRFLWFGSEGAVHKGLDLVLEAFAANPQLELEIAGPIERERAFFRAFRRELFKTPNIRYLGWVDIGSREFRELTERVVALVYPSCSEGQNGGTVTCLHAALPAVVTPQVGVDVDTRFGIVLQEATPEAIARACRELAERTPEELRQMALAAWTFAREHHTRERFQSAYRQALCEILQRFRPQLAERLSL
jgi:hypothetical protein